MFATTAQFQSCQILFKSIQTKFDKGLRLTWNLFKFSKLYSIPLYHNHKFFYDKTLAFQNLMYNNDNNRINILEAEDFFDYIVDVTCTHIPIYWSCKNFIFSVKTANRTLVLNIFKTPCRAIPKKTHFSRYLSLHTLVYELNTSIVLNTPILG